MIYTQKDIERFYSKINTIEEGPNTGCWDIDCFKDKDEYPNFQLNKRPVRGNRFMYQIHHQDENIKGFSICHSCDNPWCVNPDHLWLGTMNDNMQDKVYKGRQSRGSSHGLSKIDDEKVIEMLEGILSNRFKSIRELKNYFQVSQYIIGKILNKQTRQHLTKKFNLKEIKSKLEYSQLGVNNSRSKFNTNEILNIRKHLKNGSTIKSLADFYDVDNKTIYNIKNNISYTNIV